VDSQKTSRLSGIQTCWAIVFDASSGEGPAVISAQQRLLMRYYRSIRHYLCALVHDPEVAEELTHDFVVRFLRGDFKQANPARGRFRDLLKRSLRNLAIDYWRRQHVGKNQVLAPLPADFELPCGRALDAAGTDETFLRSWRKEMMKLAAQALEHFDQRSGRSYYAILHFKAAHPENDSTELAALFGAHVGKPFTATAFRQLVHRAREKFANLLITEVASSLNTSDPDAIEEELIDLALFPFCRHSMLRLRESNFLRQGHRLGDGKSRSA
jgi:RNA polymerase sigma-70 factor (ECF subfamily)